MNCKELSSKMRAKYPGSYDDLSDDELARKVISKYPQYSDTTFDDTKPSLAATVTSAISPEDPNTQKGSILQRLYAGTKEMFVPSYEGIKRLFNPNLGQFGPSRVLEQEGKKIAGAVSSAGQNIAEGIAESKFGAKAPATSAALGAGISTATDITAPMLTPTAMQAQLSGTGMKIGGSVVGEPIANALKEAAIDPARRSLGIIKGQLTSSKSGFEAIRKQALANEAASKMLERGAISKIGSAGKTTENAFKILNESTKIMDDVIGKAESVGANIRQDDLATKLIDGLKPRLPEQQAIVTKMLDDIQSLPQEISLTEAKRVLKDYWGTKGFDTGTVGTVGTSFYRKAATILENEIKSAIKNTGDDSLIAAYSSANKTYGASVTALRGLGNKLASEMGNNFISLPSTIWAASRLAAGDLAGTVAAVGASEGAKRFGSGALANMLYGASKTATPRVPFLQALVAVMKKKTDKK